MHYSLNKLRRHYLEPRKNVIKASFFTLTLACTSYLWYNYVFHQNEPIEVNEPSKLELKTNLNNLCETNHLRGCPHTEKR